MKKLSIKPVNECTVVSAFIVMLIYLALVCGMKNSVLAAQGGGVEAGFQALLAKETDEEVLMFDCADFDGDGTYEAFAFTGTKYDDEYAGRLWFINDEGADITLEENYYWSVDGNFTVNDRRYVVLEYYYATASISQIYGVKNGKPYRVSGPGGGELDFIDADSITVVHDAYDGVYDKEMGFYIGHSWKTYYLYWDNGFREYGGIHITEKAFLEFQGAAEVLAEIKADGCEVNSIIYRANGIIHINYSKEDSSMIEYDNITLRYDGDSVEVIGQNNGVYMNAMNHDIAVYPSAFTHPVKADDEYETLYMSFIQSGEWAVGESNYGDEYDVSDLEDFNYAIFDLDDDGVPELLLSVHDSTWRSYGITALYTIEENHVKELLLGYQTGGTTGGYYVQIYYDKQTSRHVAALNGYAGGFGGRASWVEFYTYENGELSIISKVFHINQTEKNYTENELQDPTLFYDEGNGMISVYEIDGVRSKKEDYQTVADRFVTISEEALVGVWHESPMVPAGFASRYRFSEDGTFAFENSDMDGEQRLVAYGGSWSILNGVLVLSIEHQIIMEGGEVTYATGSTGTDYEITGENYRLYHLDQPESLTFLLSEAESEREDLRSIKIGGQQFWDFTFDDGMFKFYDSVMAEPEKYERNNYVSVEAEDAHALFTWRWVNADADDSKLEIYSQSANHFKFDFSSGEVQLSETAIFSAWDRAVCRDAGEKGVMLLFVLDGEVLVVTSNVPDMPVSGIYVKEGYTLPDGYAPPYTPDPEPTAEELRLDKMPFIFGFADETGERLICNINSYSTGKVELEADLTKFTLAIGSYGQIVKIEFAGWQNETKENNYRDTSYNFDNLPGYIFHAPEGGLVRGDTYILTSETIIGDSLITLIPPPPAQPGTSRSYMNEEDIKRIEALKSRSVVWAELIAATEDGACIGLVLYERLEDEEIDMLFSIVYMDDERTVFYDEPAVYDFYSTWRVDAGDEPGWFDILFLAWSDRGLVLAFEWAAPEGGHTIVLYEDESSGGFSNHLTYYYRYWVPD